MSMFAAVMICFRTKSLAYSVHACPSISLACAVVYICNRGSGVAMLSGCVGWGCPAHCCCAHSCTADMVRNNAAPHGHQLPQMAPSAAPSSVSGNSWQEGSDCASANTQRSAIVPCRCAAVLTHCAQCCCNSGEGGAWRATTSATRPSLRTRAVLLLMWVTPPPDCVVASTPTRADRATSSPGCAPPGAAVAVDALVLPQLRPLPPLLPRSSSASDSIQMLLSWKFLAGDREEGDEEWHMCLEAEGQRGAGVAGQARLSCAQAAPDN